ncbi:MAG: hypothetical protein ACR2Q4_23280 [Geminicoccaceae bacterium]
MAVEPPNDLSRVVVIGTSCSGKTTFARELAAHLDAPHFELDALHWLPGWVAREPLDFRSLIAEQVDGHAWVTEGNYKAVRHLIFERASAIIWLNYPFPLVLWRAIKRTTHRAITGQKVCGDNRESIRIAFFSRHSIILWVITSFHRRRRDYRALFDGDAFPHAEKIELTSQDAAAAFLSSINRRKRHS